MFCFTCGLSILNIYEGREGGKEDPQGGWEGSKEEGERGKGERRGERTQRETLLGEARKRGKGKRNKNNRG